MGSHATTENGDGAKRDRPGLRSIASARHDVVSGWQLPLPSPLDVGAAFKAGAVAITSARWMVMPAASVGRERPVLDFWQRLASEGVSILGLMIDTGDPLAGRPRGARWEPRQAGASSTDGQDDAGERAVIEQEFAAKVAAAQLCTPRTALRVVVQALRQEQRSRLAALQAKVATRRDARAAEVLARHYRHLAEMVARGVPVPAQRPSVEDVRQRIRAAIMRYRPG